jgi:hypothetical protein
VQMAASTDMYSVSVAEGELPNPDWPKQSMSELLKLGFRDKIINHDNVPIMRRLRGLE